MERRRKKDMFWRWGEAMYSYRKLVVGVWLVLFIVLAIFAQKAPELLKDNGFTPKGAESDIGLHRMQENLGVAPSFFTLVYESRTLNLADTSVSNKIVQSLEPLKRLPYVSEIIPSPPSRLDESLMVQSYLVSLTLSVDEALEQYPDIRKKITAIDGTQVYLTGGTRFYMICRMQQRAIL